MADDQLGWVRDRIMSIERDLGGMHERQRGAEATHHSLRQEVKDDFLRVDRTVTEAIGRVTEIVQRENAHTRGEIERLDRAQQEQRRRDEEARVTVQRDSDQRNKDLVDSLRKEVEAARDVAKTEQSSNRKMIAAIVIIAAVLQQALERAPAILGIVEQVFQ